MKINTISLKFSDIDDENARLEVVLDPPLPEGTTIQDTQFEEQPCLNLAGRVMAFLNFLRQSEGEAPDGGSRNLIQTVH
jgi:hypothetical protein